eukprot:Phypoly_transcript_09203.p1 GENE.Phypoly_transcript_09203~~Phypoly_transcript_09203.p1  ORF type:complete len:394 (+),score=45.37 Phypoly_transcript_09203:240-1421(+)
MLLSPIGLSKLTGIDVGIVEITHENEVDPVISLKPIYFESSPWPDSERDIIFKAFSASTTVPDICRANFILGEAFAKATLQAIKNANLRPSAIQLIGSHGQTIWHDVKDGKVTSTLQIGEAAVIAVRTGITTISNFRVADVAVGGQGAPLASTFDYLLMRPTGGKWRALQNIGGIGNVTFIPPKGVEGDPIAFDTGPGNVLIDWYCLCISNGTMKCDLDGAFGSKGKINEDLLAELLSHPYLSQKPPKSTGRELYTKQYVEQITQKATTANISTNDAIATLTELTALSIVDSYRKWAPGRLGDVIIGGGGARNPFLMERLQHNFAQMDKDICVQLNEDVGFNSDGKESFLFALLAYLCFHGLPGNVPKATGASEATILGTIAPGKNFCSIQLK